MPLLLTAAVLSLAAACSDAARPHPTPLSAPASAQPSAAPGSTVTVREGQAFTLAPGATAALAGSSAKVSFTGVSADSRCPVDVECVWAGDATVELATPDGPLTLHTLPPATTPPVRLGPYRLTLVTLLPERRSDASPAPGSYRLSLRLDP
ncbi:hypothetical protein GCM10022221_34200 [Actinocorallia aurea]